MLFKDVRAKIFHSIDFLNSYCSQIFNNCVRNEKKMGVTVFVSAIKRVKNYPDFEKLVHIIQHGLQGFIVKKYRRGVNGGKRSQSYFVEVGLLRK